MKVRERYTAGKLYVYHDYPNDQDPHLYIGNFKILPPAVDERTTPTGKFAEYPHPHWYATLPERYPAKEADKDVPEQRIKKGQKRAFGNYEIHEPEQHAYGDWASICIGGQTRSLCTKPAPTTGAPEPL